MTCPTKNVRRVAISSKGHAAGWQEWRDSNPQPPVLETGALPIELRPLAVRDTKCIGAFFGNTQRVTDQGIDEQTHPEEDELLEEQEHKGYGEDEGERDESFPDDSTDDS